MSRIECGAQPDLASITRLCAWLAMPPSGFFSPVTARPEEPLEQAIAHLNADPRLSAGAAVEISNVLTEMYANLAKFNPVAKPIIACHLRAAPVMRPGVPHRLSALLDDMHTALVERVAQEEEAR